MSDSRSDNPVVLTVVSRFAAFLTVQAQSLLGFMLHLCMGPQGAVATSLVAQRYRDARQQLVVPRRDLESAAWSAYFAWKGGGGKLPEGMTPTSAVQKWIARYAVEAFWGDLLIKPQNNRERWEIQLLSVFRIALSILRPSFNLDGDHDGCVSYYDDSVSSEEAAEDVAAFFDMDDVALELYFRVETDTDDRSSRSNIMDELREEELEEWRAKVVNSTKPGIGRAIKADDRFIDHLLGLSEDSMEISFNGMMSRNKNEVSVSTVSTAWIERGTNKWGQPTSSLVETTLFKSKRSEPWFDKENNRWVVDDATSVGSVDKTTSEHDRGVYFAGAAERQHILRTLDRYDWWLQSPMYDEEKASPAQRAHRHRKMKMVERRERLRREVGGEDKDLYYVKERVMTILRNVLVRPCVNRKPRNVFDRKLGQRVTVSSIRHENRDNAFNDALGRPFAVVSKPCLAEYYGETQNTQRRDALMKPLRLRKKVRAILPSQAVGETVKIRLNKKGKRSFDLKYGRWVTVEQYAPQFCDSKPYGLVEAEVRFAVLRKKTNRDGTVKKSQDKVVAIMRSTEFPEITTTDPYVVVPVYGALRQEVLLSLGLSGRTVDNKFDKDSEERFEYVPYFPRNQRHHLVQIGLNTQDWQMTEKELNQAFPLKAE